MDRPAQWVLRCWTLREVARSHHASARSHAIRLEQVGGLCIGAEPPVPVGQRHGRVHRGEGLFVASQVLPVPRQEGRPAVGAVDARGGSGVPVP